jgi:hypothetical protein
MWLVVAPSCLSLRDASSGPYRRLREVFPPTHGCRAGDVVESVVVVEVALSPARDQAKEA